MSRESEAQQDWEDEETEVGPDWNPKWRIEGYGDVLALLFFLAFMLGLFLLWFGRLLEAW